MRKTIQQMLMLAACAAVPTMMGAATLSVDEAKDIAAEFFQSGDVHRLSSSDAFVLAHTAVDRASNPICYVFNARDGKGFVIVSADDSSLPVIGYSDVSTWNASSVSNSVEQVIIEPVKVSADTRRRVLSKASALSEKKVLSTPEWSQEAPFNNNIPNRRLTGCVGVALAEILKYHNYPAERPASLVGEGETTTYNWAGMRTDNHRNGYSEEDAAAVATLVADAAIGIGTDFGMSSSSAYEVKVPYALTSLFGYDAGVSYKKRSEMDRDSWDQVIVNEIDADRPVLYCGQDVSAGHAFVCDGYEMRGSTPYFHINWGWGGSANGFYATDALNPVVSKAHKYNDLMTIIYGIKPAADKTVWSDLHITSDESQPGITLNVSDISAADSFTVRAGAVKNISNTDFAGQIAVALFDAAGNQKCLLSDARNFSLWALQITKYVDFSCKLPAGTSVADSDKVRLVSKASGASEWRPVAGNPLSPGEVSAKNYEVPYIKVTLPYSLSNNDYTITVPEPQAIRGRDFLFTLTQHNPARLITVKANGFILTPDGDGNYRIANVLEPQQIIVNNQLASSVLSKATLWVTAGNLQNLLTEDECASVKNLTLYGTINANDFTFMRDRMKLERLDISQTSIVALGSNPANAIPTKAFQGYTCLQEIILPYNLTTLKNGCFNRTSLRKVDIPASVGTWEYNVFLSCGALQEVIVRRSSPAWINWCVFNGTPKAKLRVPYGAKSAYEAKEYWQDFKEIVEGVPSPSDEYTVTLAEKKGIKFTKLVYDDYYWAGDPFEFKVETDNSLDDYVMQVYINSTLLTPDANGRYKTTINCNSLVHVEFKQPQATTVDKTWKLTGEAGGIGLVTNVINVPVGQTFTVRANAIKIPKGDDAAKFYAMVLTDKNGAIKEFISQIVSNYYSRAEAVTPCNFYCTVKESQIKEGNRIHLATSYNKRDWQLVEGDSEEIVSSLAAVGNQVAYHSVTMPTSVTGARIEGAATEVVRGMPFTIKASAIDPAQRVTVGINGETKAFKVANANVTIPAVLEDLDVTILVQDADAGDFMVFNISEGQLASKLAEECPARVKLVGSMNVSDFNALRANASKIIDLDLSEVTIKGAMMTGNQIPENAFAPSNASDLSALRTVIFPNNLERFDKNALARCTQISEITIPANVSYVGAGAFSACVALKKIIAQPKVAPGCGNTSPFPSNTSSISLEVPKGSEESYSVPSTWWAMLPLYKKPTEQIDYYWVKLDQSRVGVTSGNPSKVAVGQKEEVTMQLTLPNNQSKQHKPFDHVRPGVAFKVYDNGIDVFNNAGAYSNNVAGERLTPAQSWSMVGGRMLLRWNPAATSGVTMPQNHEITLDFYYSLDFESKEGAQGVTAEIVEKPEGCEWRNVSMSQFQYQKGNSVNTEVKPLLYKEGCEMKVQLSNTDPKTVYTMKAVTNFMTKTGFEPVYEQREVEIKGDNGLFTIPGLTGDTRVYIYGEKLFEEGEVIPAEALSNVVKEDVIAFTELTVSGEMGEEEFENIREKFEFVETLDLSQIQNEVIPEGAFAGMEHLSSVTVPETITEIGAGAFAGCENIETLTLPGVNSIGEGAFEGCTSLTSILIPASGSTPSPSGAPRKIAPRSNGGITAESFRGLNPNCLIYVGSTDIPDAEELNIILNQNGVRVAASDIILDGNHAFNAPASFMVGDHRISFTVDIAASNASDVDGGWSTIMLPFQPTGMEFGEEIGEREGSGIHILSFDNEEAEAMTEQAALLPNRPYLANVCAPYASVPVTFYASGNTQAESEEMVYDVPYTPVPEETYAAGKDFTLYGSFDGETRNVDYYVLNDEASAFVAPTEGVDKVTPFSAYLCANAGVTADEVAVGEHPLWISEPAATGVAGTKLYRSGKIELACANPWASIYYTVDGSDPKDSETRVLYTGSVAMEAETMNIRAYGERKGYNSEVVDLAYELKKSNIDYELAENWNWISHNAESPVAVSDFVTGGVRSILSHTQEAVNDPKYGLVGTLKELAPVATYKVFVEDKPWSGKVSGVAYDPVNTVKLNKGWNWIGAGVDEGSLLISDLLSGLNAEEGDMLVGLDGFVQADADGVWQGTLSEMTPGVGYMYFSNSAKEFSFTLTEAHAAAAPAKAPVVAADGIWTVDNHKYASVMPVTAALDVDMDGYMVAAFCGTECRGIGARVDDVVMINVHGNPGDVIDFRFINDDNEQKQSSTSLVFAEKPEGTIANPFAISTLGATSVAEINVGSIGITYADGSFVLNGDMSDVKAVEIFDLAGKMIAKSTGARSLNVGNLDGSVVTVVIRTADSTSSVKMIVK